MSKSYEMVLTWIRFLSLIFFPEYSRIYTFKHILRSSKRRLYLFRHEKNLNAMTEMEQFSNYISDKKKKYLMWVSEEKESAKKRLEFQSVVNNLGLELKGINFLDIGPGYGDSLDICYEEGAKCIEFLDRDIFIFTYNRLKGYTKGYQLELMTGLSKLEPEKYDLIWSKATISPEFFLSIMKLKIISLPLASWLAQLERIVSATGHIIICPHWAAENDKRNIQDVRHNWFTETMLSNGYVILPKIEKHNAEPNHPVTFYKNMCGTPKNLR